MQPIKISTQNFRAVAKKPSYDIHSKQNYSKSDIQHHNKTKFQDPLGTMDISRRQTLAQNLSELAETEGFSDIYTHKFKGYFMIVNENSYLNGEKNQSQAIAFIKIFKFIQINDEILFLGCTITFSNGKHIHLHSLNL